MNIFRNLLKSDKGRYLTGKDLDSRERKVLKCLRDEGIDKTLSPESLEGFLEIVKRAHRARQNWFRWQYWRLFDKDRTQVERVAQSNDLLLTEEGLGILAEKVQNRLRVEKLIRDLNEYWPAVGLYEEAGVQSWINDYRQALKARKITEKIPSWPVIEPLLLPKFTDFQQKIFQLFSVTAEWMGHLKIGRTYLTDHQIQAVLQQPEQAEALASALQEDFEALVELDQLKAGLSGTEKDVIGKLESYLQRNPPVSWTTLLDNSLRLAWIEHIEGLYPILRAASNQKLGNLENDLQESIRRKMALSRNMLLLKLREQTYRNIENNRLGNRVTYRDLEHQVTKKRNIWPVRKLLTSFHEEILQLVPCWMASPESVSALFSLEPQFDLVIFDEASQCFAERGIPAIYRAHQTVVTGDDQQLQPSDLYRVRFEDESEEDPDLEVDSLLDLAVRYFPQTQLTGHYRSQSLDLIEFSNRHFYDYSLQLLPDFGVMNLQEPAISYLKTEGIWEKNTNAAEAERVVQLLAKLIREKPGKDIGVVTFNFPQQQLIQDLLDEYALEHRLVIPKTLFIKNIENVQGDERDIIIFSIGYAPDAKGRMALQFGSLNQAGGANRLNVAVTRAREKIFVVTSILPPQLHTEGTLHRGPKLLKQYLEYAWQVSEGAYQPTPRKVEGFRSGQLLKDRLLQTDGGLVKELPFADLTQKQGAQYMGLVLTDDDLYFASLSAKDAHADTHLELEQKDWFVRRVYSREWWKVKLQG